MNKYLVIIPCYRHVKTIEGVIKRLLDYQLRILVIDDGNQQEDARHLKQICAAYPQVELIIHPHNLGKGAAIYTAFVYANKHGFSHAIQVDADGQHCIEDLPTATSLSDSHPQAIISATPIYDSSIPKARLYGRKITNFFVKLECLDFKLQDAMIGFRVYPVKICLKLSYSMQNSRMNYDPQILVKARWQKIKVYFFKTKVIYPLDGISNFKTLWDNLRISLMHTKLCLCAPVMLLKRLILKDNQADE